MLELTSVPTHSWTTSPAGLRPPRGPRALLQLFASQMGSVFWDIMAFCPTLVARRAGGGMTGSVHHLLPGPQATGTPQVLHPQILNEQS